MNDESQTLSQDKRTLLALRRMQAKIDALEGARSAPIAIIGMSCRFPGGANDPESFWRLLSSGTDAIIEIPSERWDVDAYFDRNADAPGKIATRWGGFLDQIDAFDAGFFGISPREALHMDPQQRLLLEVAWEALERAGQPVDALAGSQTGVFIGMSTSDYFDLQTKHTPIDNVYVETGNRHGFATGRLSYLLNFRGPSVAVDTLCSSSLVAVHLACQSLRAQECRMALAGGINLILSPQSTIMTSKWGVMAGDGRCKPFDARADGVVRSEGCGVVALKKLADALADGDPVLALIRGSAINQDGRSAGLTAPNGQAQQALLRQALREAHVEPGVIGYVETHGTGTPLGDPIEVEALAAVLGAPSPDGRTCALGGLKSNIGHTEAAAGVASLIKAVLSLQHKTIPANLHFQTLNPHIALEPTRLVIPTANLPWPTNGTRRFAGVSAFGLSGTNAHVILEEAPAASPQPSEVAPTEPPYVVPLSARSAEALTALAQAYRARLAATDAPALIDLAYTTACRRAHHPHRLALVANSPSALREHLDAFLRGEARPGLASGVVAGTDKPRLAFVFPGQGAQWPGMARSLLAQEPVFRQAIAQCAQAFQPFVAWSLLDQFQAPVLPSAIDVLQPMLFAIAVGLSALWQHWGVRPDALVGHSMGEIAAAYVAGALTLEDAARVICRRSQLLCTVSGQGAMALVELSVDEAEAALAPYADRLSVAVCNSPRSTVIAGDPQALDAVLTWLETQQVFCRRIKADVASHSPQMEPLTPRLHEQLAGLCPRTGHTPLYSTVEPRVLDGHELDAGYWMRNLRQPVQFGRAIGQLADDGVGVFVELSPHPLLLQAIASGLRERGQAGLGLASLRRDEDERATLLGSLGALYTAGYPLDWARLFPHGGRMVVLPTYPWQRARYWLAPPPAGAMAVASSPPQLGEHPLLGTRISSAAQPGTHLWETSVSLASYPWLAEHQLQGRAVLPGAAYLELALAAARALWGDGAHILSDIRFTQLLTLALEEQYTLQLVLTADLADAAQFEIFSRPARDPQASWISHAGGRIQRNEMATAIPETMNLLDIQARCAERSAGAAHYERLADQGLAYGPNFQGVVDIRRRRGEALGRLAHTESVMAEGASYLVHPALLDAGFHVLNAAAAQDDNDTYLPVGVARVQVHACLDSVAWSYARLEATESGTARRGDVLLLDTNGQVLVEVRGMHLQRLGIPQRDPVAGWLYELDWQPQPLADATTSHHDTGCQWLIVADRAAAARGIGDALAIRGGRYMLATCEPALGRPDTHQLRSADAKAFRPILQALATVDQPHCRNVVILADEGMVDAERMLLDTTRNWARVVALVQALAQQGWRDAPRLWLVTRGAQAVTTADTALTLATAPLWGLGRTIMYEQPELRCTLIDLPAAALPDEADTLAAELLAQTAEDQVALRADGRFVARLQRHTPAVHATPGPRRLAGARPFRLESDRPGTLAALTLRASSRPPPGPGEVEIAVAAAGLNFLDVLTALGVYPGQPPGRAILGQECAGTISAVGPGVDGFAPGDAVVACTPRSMGTHVVAPASCVARKPESLTFEAAAGVPITFATAYYGLHDLARLQPGERVLIHSAAGGVGLAAIQVARHLGAAVVATAGSEAKRAWLAAQGIRQVYDSRALAFAEQILADTNGQGVDVVLNSLAGAAIPASLAVLAPYGRFVEIGKKDIYANAALALAPFRKSLAYFAVDLAGMRQVRPALFHVLLQTVLERFADGTFQPVPIEVHPIAQVDDIYHRMAQGTHIGKFVISLAEQAGTSIAAAAAGAAVDSDATYLITGGLGGLGLAVTRWLVEQGARTLVLLGRRAPAQATHMAIEELRTRGATVRVVQADVADRAALQEVFDDIARALPPLRGIFHAAGVIDDGVLLQQTPERFARVAGPKVIGAWHLHTLTQALPLDHFVLFSSVAALLGSPGQGNYAAASAFMDALAHHRRAQDLPALSINWGAWAEVGLAATQANRGERLSYRGMASMTPAQGLVALERLLAQERPQVGVLPLDLRQWRQFYPQAAASPLFSRLALEQAQPGGGEARPGQFRDMLRQAEPGQRRALLQAHLRDQIAQVLRLDAARITFQVPLGNIGFDSLLALELRNRLETNLGVTLPSTLLWAYPTINVMVPFLAQKLELALEESAPAQILIADRALYDDPAALTLLMELEILEEIEGLSDEEVRQKLSG